MASFIGFAPGLRKYVITCVKKKTVNACFIFRPINYFGQWQSNCCWDCLIWKNNLHSPCCQRLWESHISKGLDPQQYRCWKLAVWNRLKEFIQNTCCFCKQSCYGVPTHGCLNFLIFSNVLAKITFFIKYMVSTFASSLHLHQDFQLHSS